MHEKYYSECEIFYSYTHNIYNLQVFRDLIYNTT